MSGPLDPADVARFRDLVRDQVGLSFPTSRLPDVEGAVRRAVAETGLPDTGALHQALADRTGRPKALDALVSALNVSETHFFRDRRQVEALERRVLPELVVRRRRQRRLRIWSAACSTGEEAYTLAILVSHQLPDLAAWDVRILATDVNGRSLEQARQGCYGPWSFRGVPPRVKQAWFVPDGERFRVTPSIRTMVTFKRLNLVDPIAAWSPADPWDTDLLLCRNVLLYFDGATTRAVVGRLAACLADDGRLLLSQVEAALGSFEGLEPDAGGSGAFRKTPPAPAPPSPSPVDAPVDAPAVPRRHDPGRPSPDVAVPPPVPALGAYEAALELWRDDRPEDALRRLRLEGSHSRLRAPLHYLEGLILLDTGRADEALAAFRRCTFTDPGFALGHLAQANLFTRAGKHGRALAALERTAGLVVGLDPAARVFAGDELRAGTLLELVDAQRQLLRLPATPEAVDG